MWTCRGGPATLREWFGVRYCRLGEPVLQRGATRAVRCGYRVSFKPLVVVRLDATSCRATASVYDDTLRDGGVEVRREQRVVAGCDAMVRAAISEARKGAGSEKTPPGTMVVDGAEWVFDARDDGRTIAVEVPDPVQEPARQVGAARACQLIWEAGVGPGTPDEAQVRTTVAGWMLEAEGALKVYPTLQDANRAVADRPVEGTR